MLRALILATLILTSIVPVVPTASASCTNVTQQRIHGNSKLPFEDTPESNQIDCCARPTLAVIAGSDTYYVVLQPPVAEKTFVGPHPNSRGNANLWLATFQATLVLFNFYSPVDPGDVIVAVRSPGTDVFLYQETNGHAGLQPGDTGRLGTDGCRDFSYLESIDSLVV